MSAVNLVHAFVVDPFAGTIPEQIDYALVSSSRYVPKRGSVR